MAGDTPGPSGTAGDRYLEDISADELSANAPADETDENRTARRERNRKRNERRRRLRDNLPIRNLAEALDQVESRVHTTPEQCLMSITTIARQAQGMHAGEVIAKLAEDAYFMRVDNRVAQVPPVRNRQHDNEATSRSVADNGRNRTRAELPANPNRTRATAGRPSQGGNSTGAAGGDREIVPHRDPGGGGSGGGSSNHGDGRRASGGGNRGGRGHVNSHVSGASHGGCEAGSCAVAQRLRPLHRERWWQQRHKVPLLPLPPGSSSTYIARVTREVLNRQVGPAQGSVHQQLRGRYGPLGYSHGPSNGEAGTR
jgi:hypothetical protein